MRLYKAFDLYDFFHEPYYRRLERIKSSAFVKINREYYISDFCLKNLFNIDVEVITSDADWLSVTDVANVLGLPYYAALGVVKSLNYQRRNCDYFIAKAELEDCFHDSKNSIIIKI